mgnify:FL=1
MYVKFVDRKWVKRMKSELSNLKAGWKENWRTLAACGGLPLVLEGLLHLFVYGEISGRFFYPCMFALAAGCLLWIASTLFEERVNKVVFLTLSSLITVYFEIQFVYNSIFGEFMSFWQFSFGAEAVANFWQQMLYGIWEALPRILLLLLPQAALFVLVLRSKWGFRFPRSHRQMRAVAGALAVALHLGALGAMALNNDNAFSVYRLYQNPNTATEISVQNIGLLPTARIECKYILLGETVSSVSASYYADGEKVDIDLAEMGENNMLAIDFDALEEETDDELLKKLDNYFAQQEPTRKNQYTGIFQGYNLITICAESFSPYLIDPERTPALYELSTNGFVFNNYYGTFGSNTTNGEYTYCVGLYPDLSRQKTTASFFASQNNYLPFCLGNSFKSVGAETWAYHNYAGEYYSRSDTHPNMGYTFKSATDGLDIELNWPSSDLEMMEKSVDDYIDSGEQFCTYYMTFSGHYQYNWDNPMSAKNRDVVEDLPYSETVKAYIACNMELEYALEYLMDRLEQAGIADETVIVLTNDHYPYGLTEEEYDQLAGREVDTTFEKYRNSFICYVPGVQIPVDTYCSTADILPTLLNLFGLPYDSRLLAGKDVLSEDANNYAVLSDQSFISADFSFDTATGTAAYFSEDLDREAADQRIVEIQQEIADKFSVSTDMLAGDYFAHALLGKEAGAAAVKGYDFTDITDAVGLGALDYVYGNGYMDAVSDTEFGFALPATYAEFLNALYEIDGGQETGSPAEGGAYAPAITWAKENGLIDPSVGEVGDSTPLTRKNLSVSLYAYADYLGLNTWVSRSQVASYQKQYPDFTREEVKAICWCFEKAVLRASGTVESAFETAGGAMSRKLVLIAVYNYHLYILS